MKAKTMSRNCVWSMIVWFACSAAPAQTSPPPELLGAWQLVSIETIRPNGEIIYPYYGKAPQGVIMYDASGWMSVQIVSDPKPTVPTTDSRALFKQAPAEQKAEAADGYYAYYGTFTVDPAASTVTHRLKESFYPGERGETVVRTYSIAGERLTLTARTKEMGEEHQRKLTWRRSLSAGTPER